MGERHPYAVLGGGTEESIHCASKQVARPNHLKLQEDEARFCKVVSGSNVHSIFYEIHGHGPIKVLMITGLGSTHTQFEPQIEALGIQKADKYTVCVADNRGIGLSDTPSGRWTTTDLASDYLQLLIQMETSNKAGEGASWSSMVHLIGLSLGGMVAQELILMAPQRFASVTLISTHAGGLLGTTPPLHGLQTFLKSMTLFGGASGLDAMLELLFPAKHLEEPVDPAQQEHVEHSPEIPLTTNRLKYAYALIRRARKYVESGNAPPEFRLDGIWRQIPAMLSHYVSWTRLERIRSYKLRVLVVSGQKDSMVGPWNSRILSEALCGKWLHFSDAGHAVNEQYAGPVNNAIEQLLEEAETQHRKSPHIATHRKPWPPSFHPLQVFFFVFGGSLLLQKKLLPSSFKFKTWSSFFLAAVLLRKNFGGFFAR